MHDDVKVLIVLQQLQIIRHPEKDERPSFQDLMLTMLMQDKLILHLPAEDLSSHPLAGTIGATLEVGQKMYEKLQLTYK